MELDLQAQNLCLFPQEYNIFDNIGLLAARFPMHPNKRTRRGILAYFFYIHEVEWIELSQSKLNHYCRLHHQLEIIPHSRARFLTSNLSNQKGTDLLRVGPELIVLFFLFFDELIVLFNLLFFFLLFSPPSRFVLGQVWTIQTRDIFAFFLCIHEVEWIELSQSKLNHYCRLHDQLEIMPYSRAPFLTSNLSNQKGTDLLRVGPELIVLFFLFLMS